jgi:hypothetical protein
VGAFGWGGLVGVKDPPGETGGCTVNIVMLIKQSVRGKYIYLMWNTHAEFMHRGNRRLSCKGIDIE